MNGPYPGFLLEKGVRAQRPKALMTPRGVGGVDMRPPQQSFEKLECQVVVLKAIALYIR